MKTQLIEASKSTQSGSRRLGPGDALRLGAAAGELSVVEGRLWLTRDGDLGDHVLEPGRRVRLARDDNAVVEPLHAGQSVVLRWAPQRTSPLASVLGAPLNGLAFLASRAAARCAALAGGAARVSAQLQGRLGPGDSGLPAR